VPKKVESCFGDGDFRRKWGFGVNGKDVARWFQVTSWSGDGQRRKKVCQETQFTIEPVKVMKFQTLMWGIA